MVFSSDRDEFFDSESLEDKIEVEANGEAEERQSVQASNDSEGTNVQVQVFASNEEVRDEKEFLS